MLFRIVPALIGALLIAACTSAAETPPSPSTATPTPTATARPTAVPRTTPTPTSDDTAAVAQVVQRFGEDVAVIAADWDAFNGRFGEWRDALTGCDEADRRADLRGWVVDFQPVSLAVTSLDFPAGTRSVRTTLTDALAREEHALHELRDEWAPGSDEAFAEYRETRTQSAINRQEARSRLAALIGIAEIEEATPASDDPTPTPTPPPPLPPGIPPGVLPPPPPDESLAEASELTEFQATLQEADAPWDAFHARYDEWRASDGRCDQGAVRDKLTSFASQFQAVLASVDQLVRPSVVRPLAEQLIEAAVSEAAAMKRLRDTWTAYDPAPWRAFDPTRASADQLRRQVRSALDELNHQFDVAVP